MVRNILDLDRRTHRILIEPLSGHLHLKTMLLSRLVTFHKGLVSSPKFTVRFLARLVEKDLRKVLGKTLHYLLVECGCKRVEDLSSGIIKKNLVYRRAPPDMTWQVAFAQELFSVRKRDVTDEGFSGDEINQILNYICTELHSFILYKLTPLYH